MGKCKSQALSLASPAAASLVFITPYGNNYPPCAGFGNASFFLWSLQEYYELDITVPNFQMGKLQLRVTKRLFKVTRIRNVRAWINPLFTTAWSLIVIWKFGLGLRFVSGDLAQNVNNKSINNNKIINSNHLLHTCTLRSPSLDMSSILANPCKSGFSLFSPWIKKWNWGSEKRSDLIRVNYT